MQVDIFKVKRRNTCLFIGVLLVLTMVSSSVTQYDAMRGFTSIWKAFAWALRNFYPNAAAMSLFSNIMVRLHETVLMAVAATTVGSAFALFFSLMGSRTTKMNTLFYLISRGIATIFRNIPVVAWAMVLLFTFGQSAMTGYLALFFTTFGFLTRGFVETIDEASESAVEALTATGAGYMPIIFNAVIPSSLPQMISWMLYMIETNIRDSTLVGLLTGTGIGFSFSLYYNMMNYNAASLVVLVIVVTILTTELLSNYIRRVIL